MAGLWCKAPSGFRFHHLETWVPSSRLPHDLRWLLERLQWSHSYPNTEWEKWGGKKEKNEGEICVSCFSLLKELSWKSQVTTFFFWCGPFLKSLLNLLQYCFCFLFWIFGCEVCGILAPWPGVKPALPAAGIIECAVPTAGPPEKSPTTS